MNKYSLSTSIEDIRRNISDIAKRFGSNRIKIDLIGMEPITSRTLAVKRMWPIAEAIEYFELEGAVKRVDDEIEIINGDYFNMDLNQITIPLDFSVDTKMEKNLMAMMKAYGRLFDIENRVRFFLTKKLKEKYGDDFFDKLPKKVKKNIEEEKAKPRIHVVDTRISLLEYSNFSDLIKIVEAEVDFIPNATHRKSFINRMELLNDARQAIGHMNLLLPDEIEKIKASCQVVRNLIK